MDCLKKFQINWIEEPYFRKLNQLRPVPSFTINPGSQVEPWMFEQIEIGRDVVKLDPRMMITISDSLTFN